VLLGHDLDGLRHEDDGDDEQDDGNFHGCSFSMKELQKWLPAAAVGSQ
jgi:hypothetical protein